MDNDPHGGSATYGVFEDEQDVSKIAPEAGGDTLGDRMEGDSRWASDSVNWFTETFLDFDLYDKLVKPISGDFNRIEANGEAWKTAGELFWRTSANLSQNMETLVEDHWSGPGADSFKNHVDLIWRECQELRGRAGDCLPGYCALIRSP
ncbi:hypothetical protein EV191_1122 [Tamaricihabitans halophyticus]|uniref:Uncharacterized protein n=1 Tax=Tamaricihabitans halophyticus TaxID=1262583 RepID=A0A4R2QFV9_9PSEU|nr:hypothetical protein [Tamaricihabitans halophyticus]TCP47208.1 hypothetical protein EV191_1122 [Tamaricihabitans halophyticus]